MTRVDSVAKRRRWPAVLNVSLLLMLGVFPVLLVFNFYDVLPNRLVTRWDLLGHMTIIATRSRTILMLALCGLAAAVTAAGIWIWQRKALSHHGLVRPFWILNYAQIIIVNLTCAMIVSEALGLKLLIKPWIAPAVAVLLFSSGTLLWRAAPDRRLNLLTIAGVTLMTLGVAELGYSSWVYSSPVSYFASAIALLTVSALAIKEQPH